MPRLMNRNQGLASLFLVVGSLAMALLSAPLVSGATDMCDNQEDAPILLTTTDALGPFYVAGSPMNSTIAPPQFLLDRSDLFVVRGKVLGNDCIPVANAQVEAWYAGEQDANGDFYSDTNYRGQVVADDCGSFEFQQTFPALYPLRPIPHIHYRISSAAGSIELLVTQLYFEGVIPAQFNPDSTKISRIVNEADGSRSAEFNIYVSIPGTANVEACAAMELETGSLISSGTMNPSAVGSTGATMEASASGTVSESVQQGTTETTRPPQRPPQTTANTTTTITTESTTTTTTTIEANEEVYTGEQCGVNYCVDPLVCCNASCGTCQLPGSVCFPVACANPPEDKGDATTTTATTRAGELFD